jgi:hypothetical protein
MGDSEGNAVVYAHGQSDYSDISLSPNQTEAEVRGAEYASKSLSCSNHSITSQAVRPHGYNEGEQPSVLALQIIPPGGHRLFSLPASHVSNAWHIEVPFRFALKHGGPKRQPYSYVAFFWDDLLEAYRSAHTVTPSQTVPATSTLLHESGHAEPPKKL